MNSNKDNVESIKLIDLAKVDESSFAYRGVGCVVLTWEHKILLQQRGDDWLHFPGMLATFGGQIEVGETSMQALVRELREELGAQVKESGVVSLGAITEAVTGHQDLIYIYFWHDKQGTITGCYEGEAKYYGSVEAVLAHSHVMDDVCWALRECQKRGLLK